MVLNLKAITEKTVSIDEYMNNLSERFGGKFLERKRAYEMNEEAVEKLRNYVEDVFILVFSAEWCKDCADTVPVLALLAEETELAVRVFGGLKTDPLNPKEKWRIPPSPPEVKKFEVQEIPHIIVSKREGVEIGTIVEKPKLGSTLEAEILSLVQE